MKYSKIIYKKDTKGKIRILRISVHNNEVISESGLLHGKLKRDTYFAEAKNINRSNETTPNEQAILEAQSKINSKMTEGYFDTIDEAQSNIIILPMLAKDYNKEKHKIVFPCYTQPKLDGMRGLGQANKQMLSRTGKTLTTMSHIEAELISLPNDLIIDGELYAHGISFQANMKLIKKYRQGETEKIKYHVYDLILDKPFKERYDYLASLVLPMENIELVPTIEIHNEDELKQVHQKYLNQGYEGTIVRHSNAGYAINKRDSQLLKYKDFIDIACKIIDIVPSEKRPEQGVCVCEIITKNGIKTFHTGMKFSHAKREEILNNKNDYINKTAEIRFFEYTDDGLPRFPICVGFREDK